MQASLSSSERLPLTQQLTAAYVISCIIALGMAAASVVGLLVPAVIYPTAEMQQAFVPNDVVNLLIGLPMLLGSMWLTRRKRLVGLLFWPGALLYVLYNYIVYLFGRPFDWLSLLNLALVALSAVTMFSLLKNMDKKAIQAQLTGAVPTNMGGWVLVIFGVMFCLRAIGMLAEAGTSQMMLSAADVGLLLADIILSLLWLAGGVLLLRKTALGYAGGLGLLFVGSVLFVGLMMVLLLQPILTEAPFALVDLLVIAAMGLVCFIPFLLFLRGVMSKESAC
ncbi:MAG: hypothetical protein KC413_18305 [Anaerolineales bacterium]|nr:hypothetical protein [Anaerolineales bacterium]